MMSWPHDLGVAAALVGMLAIALEAGFRAGRRASGGTDEAVTGQMGAIQGAVLGLLGLLLAFSFGAAGTRFIDRQQLIVQEANAIGTAYLRADLLDEPYRSALRAALEEYTAHRIALSERLRSGISATAEAEIARFHARIWDAARGGVVARPAATLAVLPPVNEVIDLHATRVATGMMHLPTLVVGLLIGCSVLSTGVIGYGCGLGGRRNEPLTLSLALLIGTALWITIDLDQPRGGLIRVNDAPLKALTFDRVGH
jgi:hypothetical protein